MSTNEPPHQQEFVTYRFGNFVNTNCRDNQSWARSAQEDLLPGDVENLSECGEDTPVTEDCPCDCETDQEPLLQQEPAGSHYPVRNRHPPNILCYDRLANPSYHPISTLSTSATNTNVSVYLPSLPVTPYGTLAIHNHWMIPYSTAVYLASVPFMAPSFHQYVPAMTV